SSRVAKAKGQFCSLHGRLDEGPVAESRNGRKGESKSLTNDTWFFEPSNTKRRGFVWSTWQFRSFPVRVTFCQYEAGIRSLDA
ncbi:MAG: hypothetical protein VYC71_00705, partial [Planctomycetota bacterium]|nr:hypothetical protein [Planctomycetota bacterium]